MLAYLRVPLTWPDLVKRTLKEALADDIFDLAAQQAYYFFFALFPALLFVIAVASFFPLQTLIDDVVTMLSRFAPQAVIDIITTRCLAVEAEQRRHPDVRLPRDDLVAARARWCRSSPRSTPRTTSPSRALVEDALDRGRLTIGIAVFILASMFLVIAGPTWPSSSRRACSSARVHVDVVVLQWPIVFALVATAIAVVYYFAPDVEQDWVWITPGSVLATRSGSPCRSR
jgi:membrane protein